MFLVIAVLSCCELAFSGVRITVPGPSFHTSLSREDGHRHPIFVPSVSKRRPRTLALPVCLGAYPLLRRLWIGALMVMQRLPPSPDRPSLLRCVVPSSSSLLHLDSRALCSSSLLCRVCVELRKYAKDAASIHSPLSRRQCCNMQALGVVWYACHLYFTPSSSPSIMPSSL